MLCIATGLGRQRYCLLALCTTVRDIRRIRRVKDTFLILVTHRLVYGKSKGLVQGWKTWG
jgi:hypothetical protein